MSYKDILNAEGLDTREKLILALRGGFLGKFTLKEVGKIFNLTHERVRQIERDTLKKYKFFYGKHKKQNTR